MERADFAPLPGARERRISLAAVGSLFGAVAAIAFGVVLYREGNRLPPTDPADAQVLRGVGTASIGEPEMYLPADGLRLTYDLGSPNHHTKVVGVVRTERQRSCIVRSYRLGVLIAEDRYHVAGGGLALVGIGPGNGVKVSPPLPVVPRNARAGDVVRWTGALVEGGRSRAARALVRIGGTDRIVTPAGVFEALRVDTAIVFTDPKGGQRNFTAKWLAKGIGIVRQRQASAQVTTLSVLTAATRGISGAGRPGAVE